MHEINKIYILLNNCYKVIDNFFIKFNFNYWPSNASLLIICILFFKTVGCKDWTSNQQKVLARVGSNYLYFNDIKNNLESFDNEYDSILNARSLIERWARNQILIQQAQINLPETKVETLDKLIDEYKIDLYSNTYREIIINKKFDSIVSQDELDSFLYRNKNIFFLKEPLYKVRYIHLPPDNVDQSKIQLSFQRFNFKDELFLDSLSYQYYSHILSEGIWINQNNLINKIKFINKKNFGRYVKKSEFFRVRDSLGVYLFYVIESLEKGDLPPLEVISPTIKNIILNQRKIKFTKEFEKNILLDAIKSNIYETY